MNVVPVAGLSDPRVEPYRTLRRIESVRKDGLFVCEGARVVRQLLRSAARVRSILCAAEWVDEMRSLVAPRPESAEVDVYVAPKDAIEGIIGYSLHQGVMALAETPRWPAVGDVATARRPHLFVALEGVSNAENVGGILRNAAGFGASGVILDRASHDPFVRRAARVSMGAVFHVPVWKVDDLPAALASLRASHGTRLLAAHLYDPVTPLGDPALDADLRADACIVLGSEATGLSAPLVSLCDRAVKIPMDDNWGCLNVATAAAVFLWECARRRG
ncbi:MAG: putative TrmH family tRNA/rRNA methyltransferase [Planctomycetes bacterium]|nr:putative TrmH family tRNA/rRNA methyltransferase [Planctomycetota bacterium]